MMSKCAILFSMPVMLLFVIMVNSAAQDDFPPIFEYRFPIVKPIKIYSGDVIFEHKKHFTDFKIGCVRCHHDVEPGVMEIEKNCRCCHGRQGFPRFAEAAKLGEEEKKEYYLIALHTLCVDCHVDTKGRDSQTRPPISCTRCHRLNAH